MHDSRKKKVGYLRLRDLQGSLLEHYFPLPSSQPLMTTQDKKESPPASPKKQTLPIRRTSLSKVEAENIELLVNDSLDSEGLSPNSGARSPSGTRSPRKAYFNFKEIKAQQMMILEEENHNEG